MTSTLTPQTKNSGTMALLEFSIHADHLLLETGFHLLQEDGNKIIVEQTGASSSAITRQTKNSGTLTNQTKN